jgi:Putative zinc-finger
MSCEQVRAQLTAYLDGEVEGDRGSAIRGHLRGCEACEQIARDEAALRDGLRALPPLDPPASLWDGVQRELAAAEVADARTPAWRRALVRFWRWAPLTPRFGIAAAAIAGSIAILAWRAHGTAPAVEPAHDELVATVAPPPRRPAPPPAMTELDVTADLASAPARVTASYAEAADELVKLALEQRLRWSEDHKQVFDTKLIDLRHAIDIAPDGRPRQKAYRALIRYLQHVTIRDEVALADTAGAP